MDDTKPDTSRSVPEHLTDEQRIPILPVCIEARVGNEERQAIDNIAAAGYPGVQFRANAVTDFKPA